MVPGPEMFMALAGKLQSGRSAPLRVAATAEALAETYLVGSARGITSTLEYQAKLAAALLADPETEEFGKYLLFIIETTKKASGQ